MGRGHYYQANGIFREGAAPWCTMCLIEGSYLHVLRLCALRAMHSEVNPVMCMLGGVVVRHGLSKSLQISSHREAPLPEEGRW
jgi:hypothetical protein